MLMIISYHAHDNLLKGCFEVSVMPFDGIGNACAWFLWLLCDEVAAHLLSALQA